MAVPTNNFTLPHFFFDRLNRITLLSQPLHTLFLVTQMVKLQNSRISFTTINTFTKPHNPIKKSVIAIPLIFAVFFYALNTAV